MKKQLLHAFLLGCAGLLMEYIGRCIGRDPHIFHPALLLMFFVSGLCGWLLGKINQSPWVFKNVNVFWQSVIGTLAILLIEYSSGVQLNIRWDLNVWSYFNQPFNLDGQICLLFGLIWFLLCPFIFRLDDLLEDWIYYGTAVDSYSLWSIYKRAWNPFDEPFYYK